MTVTTESGGRQNAFPTEVRPQLVENYEGYGPVSYTHLRAHET